MYNGKGKLARSKMSCSVKDTETSTFHLISVVLAEEPGRMLECSEVQTTLSEQGRFYNREKSVFTAETPPGSIGERRQPVSGTLCQGQ